MYDLEYFFESYGPRILAVVLIVLGAVLLFEAIFIILSVVLTQYKGFTREDIKKRGWNSLRSGKYWLALGVSVVAGILGGVMAGSSSGSFSFDFSSLEDADTYSYAASDISQAVVLILIIVFVFAFLLSIALIIFVSNIVTVGLTRFFVMNLVDRPSFGELFFGFKNGKYTKVCSIMFFRSLYTFLWSLLFVIPGIVKSFEYMMIPFILAENPDIDREDAFRLSKEMMHGNKWRTYVLGLSFFGWELLGILCCCGIGTIFLMPYINATYAALYEKLRANIPESDIEKYLSNDIFKKHQQPVEGEYTEVNSESPVENTCAKEPVAAPEEKAEGTTVINGESKDVYSGEVE